VHIGVPIIPNRAPAPCPNIKSKPFVSGGSIGKVNSAAKVIETGIIGTKTMPRKARLTPTTKIFKLGSVKMPTVNIKQTEKQMIRNGHRKVRFF